MKAASQRLFFALWPDEATRRQIDNVVHQLDPRQGRRVAPGNLHITLAFLGASSATQRECYCQAVESLAAESFALTLDCFGYWKKPRVAWLGCSAVPSSLQQLVADLNQALKTCGFAAEQRRYEPHVTLMRKADGIREPKNFRPLSWNVESFCLVESVSRPEGVQYRVLQEWFF